MWGHPVDRARETQSAVSGEEADPGNMDVCPSAYGLGGGHHGDCGLVTSGAGFEKWGHSWDC